MTNLVPRQLPLADLKILKLGQFIAGPFATKMLGEFGADVTKVEPLGTGVPLRKWRIIDVALYESVFSVMESLAPEYDATGHIHGPGGSTLPSITPSNAYRTRDGDFVLMAGNGDSIFKRLIAVIDRPDLSEDPALAHNNGRSLGADELDAASRPGRSSAATTKSLSPWMRQASPSVTPIPLPILPLIPTTRPAK